jgi:hypothetical protein
LSTSQLFKKINTSISEFSNQKKHDFRLQGYNFVNASWLQFILLEYNTEDSLPLIKYPYNITNQDLSPLIILRGERTIDIGPHKKGAS